jgi:hypothetical protein
MVGPGKKLVRVPVLHFPGVRVLDLGREKLDATVDRFFASAGDRPRKNKA